MQNFFCNDITIPGRSNLDDLDGRLCEIIIGSNSSTCWTKDYGYCNVNCRMGISQQNVQFTSLHELGIGLNLEEAEVFCEALYNLAKQNSQLKEQVEIVFSGDNNEKNIGAPKSYLKRAQTDRRRVPLAITIDAVNSTEGVVEVTLKMPAEDKFFCSAVLSGQNALILSSMIRRDYMGAFKVKMQADDFRKRERS
jgi:hypothetical protein